MVYIHFRQVYVIGAGSMSSIITQLVLTKMNYCSYSAASGKRFWALWWGCRFLTLARKRGYVPQACMGQTDYLLRKVAGSSAVTVKVEGVTIHNNGRMGEWNGVLHDGC